MAKRSGFFSILQGNGPIRARTLALILMVVGAAGFFVSLLVFGEQVLCLVASTLVVFVGLGIVVAARRYSGDPNNLQEPAIVPPRQPLMRARRDQRSPVQAPAPTHWTGQPQPAQAPLRKVGQVSADSDIISRVSMAFRRQGADVVLEMVRDQRSVLRAAVHGGMTFVIIVDEGPDEIQVSELRALHSVWANHAADGAIFISASQYSEQAVQWAHARSIIVLTEDMIETFVLPGQG